MKKIISSGEFVLLFVWVWNGYGMCEWALRALLILLFNIVDMAYGDQSVKFAYLLWLRVFEWIWACSSWGCVVILLNYYFESCSVGLCQSSFFDWDIIEDHFYILVILWWIECSNVLGRLLFHFHPLHISDCQDVHKITQSNTAKLFQTNFKQQNTSIWE